MSNHLYRTMETEFHNAKKKKNIQQQNSSSYVRHYNVDALLWLDLLSVS
jgi:hypothetical protein